MKARIHVVVVMLIALALAIISSGKVQAQTKTRHKRDVQEMTTAEILKALKPGQWVKIEGIVQKKDYSVECTKVRFLTGDFLDDDWEISGVVDRIDVKAQQFAIMRLPIKVRPDTEFESPGMTLKGISDLKVGMHVEVEGTYLKDGTFLALELEDQSKKFADASDGKNEIEAKGKIDKYDPAKRTVTVMGITFQLTEKTKGMSDIK